MPVRVYKTPTKAEPDKVAIGVPQAVQADPAITELTIVQQEILPPPTTVNDLFTQPVQIANQSVNAFQNVGVSKLTPGFKMVVTPIGLRDELIPPIPVEEVTIPDGYIHLDDASDWDVFNYNRAWTLSDRNFDVLPGEKRLPREFTWDVRINDRSFRAKYRAPIDSIRMYYRRVSTIPQDFEWVDWTFLEGEEVSFPYYGKYVFRAVPYHLGKPLPYQREWTYEWKEPDTLSWSTIQLDKDTFQVRMEGVLGQSITEVEAFEDGKSLGVFGLRPNKQGRTERTFVLQNISSAQTPEIEYRFMRRVRHHRSLVERAYQNLQRNYANEPIDFRIRRNGEGFLITIGDKENLLYTPVNAVDPFSGTQWQTAIQKQKLLVKMEIIRHQDGETRHYGTYFLNTTSEIKPNFLQSPPFTDKVERVSGGFQFEFEDTPEFRDIVNLDNPDLDKRLAYEFRLQFWSAGIEDCLRTGEDYIFTKETPVIVRNKRGSYKYSYSVWKEEHPRKKYTRRIPVDVEYKNMNDHIRYGRSPQGIVLQAIPQAVVPTRDIRVGDPEWKVLYYYNDKDDELVEFPYTYFDIEVPTSSQSTINSIEVFIEKESSETVSLGKYHPSDSISIVDFLGYYEARKMITKKTNFRKAFNTLGDISRPPTTPKKSIPRTENKKIQAVRNQSFSSISVNTAAKKIDVGASNRKINNAVAKQVEGGTLLYKILITYIDGSTSQQPVSIPVASRPAIPEEPEENSSFSIGNKTVLPSTFAVPSSAVATITNQIQQVASPTKSTTKIGFNR